MEHCKFNGIKRQHRAWRVSNAVKRVSTRPRLCVFRSLKNIYCQIIDDENGKTLASASTRDKGLLEAGVYGGNVAAAAIVGKAIAERALAAGIKAVAYDRRNFKYHGRVAALADAARDAGLDIGAKADPKAVKKSAKNGKNVGRAAKKEAKAAKAGKPGK